VRTTVKYEGMEISLEHSKTNLGSIYLQYMSAIINITIAIKLKLMIRGAKGNEPFIVVA
jgi:hypothetical protein